MVKSGIFLTTTLAEEELWAAPFALGSVAKSLVEKTILTLQTEPQMQRSVISIFDSLQFTLIRVTSQLLQGLT